MAVSYKKLWKLLIDKNMKKKDLCALAGIRFHSYLLSAGCDGAAWFTAGLFTLFAYRYMMEQLDPAPRK
jgi:hypothetical protein